LHPIIRYAVSLALVLLLLGHAADLNRIAFVDRLDAILYDAKLRLTMPNQPDPRLVILDIDEKSLAEVGRWPWNRKRMAELVTQLFDRYGVGVVGMDVLFAEPDDSVDLAVLEELGRGPLKDDDAYREALNRIRPRLDYDALFAEAMRRRHVILGYFLSTAHAGRNSGELPEPVLRHDAFAAGSAEPTQWAGFSANLAQFQRAAAGAGHMEPMVDLDGVLRRVPLLAEYRGDYYESLALAVVREVRGRPPVVPGFPDGDGGGGYGSLEWLDLPAASGHLRIPVDRNAAALVPYLGYEGTFSYVSAVDVLKGRLDRDALRGRIVLLGTTTLGLRDSRATPVGSTYPGVEVQANLIVGMLDGALKHKPYYLLGADVLQLLFAAIVMIFLVPRLSPLRATLATLATAAVLAAINLGVWSHDLVLPLAAALLLVVALFTLDMSYGYFVEARDKRLIARLFGQYVPPELVREMARNPANYSLQGRSAELTVMFCDIHAFTKFSEALEPRQLTQLMNEYLGAMTTVIRSQRGTLDKYVGDAIMAFWGAPVDDPEHARHAVMTALGMQHALVELNRRFAERGLRPLRIGIGINTGQMTVGDMGSAVRKAYTVLGDAVNVGSRLENLTRHYGVGIIVGEDTRKRVDGIAFRELDRVRVKGRQTPISIFEPLGEAADLGDAQLRELALWTQALGHYRVREWDEAQRILETLSAQHADAALYSAFLARIAAFRTAPPGDAWDGVTTFETK
jgi:adenylate cyclase